MSAKLSPSSKISGVSDLSGVSGLEEMPDLGDLNDELNAIDMQALEINDPAVANNEANIAHLDANVVNLDDMLDLKDLTEMLESNANRSLDTADKAENEMKKKNAENHKHIEASKTEPKTSQEVKGQASLVLTEAGGGSEVPPEDKPSVAPLKEVNVAEENAANGDLGGERIDEKHQVETAIKESEVSVGKECDIQALKRDPNARVDTTEDSKTENYSRITVRANAESLDAVNLIGREEQKKNDNVETVIDDGTSKVQRPGASVSVEALGSADAEEDLVEPKSVEPVQKSLESVKSLPKSVQSEISVEEKKIAGIRKSSEPPKGVEVPNCVEVPNSSVAKPSRLNEEPVSEEPETKSKDETPALENVRVEDLEATVHMSRREGETRHGVTFNSEEILAAEIMEYSGGKNQEGENVECKNYFPQIDTLGSYSSYPDLDNDADDVHLDDETAEIDLNGIYAEAIDGHSENVLDRLQQRFEQLAKQAEEELDRNQELKRKKYRMLVAHKKELSEYKMRCLRIETQVRMLRNQLKIAHIHEPKVARAMATRVQSTVIDKIDRKSRDFALKERPSFSSRVASNTRRYKYNGKIDIHSKGIALSNHTQLSFEDGSARKTPKEVRKLLHMAYTPPRPTSSKQRRPLNITKRPAFK